ncbi:MAG: glutamate--tRNA ligase [Thermodesulfovibrionales bacterium]|nr:glutamate--tRNA ligase [Thermodesulfovibrionales bacterium]
MKDQIRVRFAPSPTGFLHIGGARTALFNWLFAKHHDGVFILRIEDTDRSRSTDDYMKSIIEDMQWLGLHWDEGPYRQTDRFEIYKEFAKKLLKEEKAYYCYCSAEELETKRQAAISSGLPVKYDGKCRELDIIPEDKPAAIRFKMPQEGQTIVNDLIKGKVIFDNTQLEDLVIVRSDGTPTYNFVVVVDDIEMRISHIIRGDDHLNNTPKQIHIYKAFNSHIPEFAHLPMILGHDKSRLSKRHGATSVHAYREMGYLPEALVNYLVRLGWSYGDKEIFSKEEMIKLFSLENIGKSAAVFNPDKLLWLNSQYIMNTDSEKLAELILPFLIKDNIITNKEEVNKKWLAKAIDLLKERSKTLQEMANSLKYFISDLIEIDPKAKDKFLTSESIKFLAEIKELLLKLDDFSSKNIEKIFINIAQQNNLKLGSLAQPMRVAITGSTASPGIFELMETIGKEKVIKRLSKVIAIK